MYLLIYLYYIYIYLYTYINSYSINYLYNYFCLGSFACIILCWSALAQQKLSQRIALNPAAVHPRPHLVLRPRRGEAACSADSGNPFPHRAKPSPAARVQAQVAQSLKA